MTIPETGSAELPTYLPAREPCDDSWDIRILRPVAPLATTLLIGSDSERRPSYIGVVDCEATSTDPQTVEVIDLAVCVLEIDRAGVITGVAELKQGLRDPGMPIPKALSDRLMMSIVDLPMPTRADRSLSPAYPERLVIVAEGQFLCEHERIIDRSHHRSGRTIYDWRHYLADAQRKPGALRNGAPFLEMPEAFRQLQVMLLKRLGGDKEMIEILSLVLHHDKQAVLRAVELALEDGVATKTHVLNILHRLIDGEAPPAPPIDAPQTFRLGKEPKANVGRYDTLSELRHAS